MISTIVAFEAPGGREVVLLYRKGPEAPCNLLPALNSILNTAELFLLRSTADVAMI